MPEGGVNEPARREPLRVNSGEWFFPLRGVASLPDTIRKVNEYRSKTVEMYVEGVGEMRLSLDSIDAGMLDVPMTVTLSEEDRATDLSGALDLRRTIKNELFGIMFVADAKRFLGKELPFVVKMRTPSGNIYRNTFSQENGEPPRSLLSGWNVEGQNTEGSMLLVPDSEYIMANVQFLFEKKQNEKFD